MLQDANGSPETECHGKHGLCRVGEDEIVKHSLSFLDQMKVKYASVSRLLMVQMDSKALSIPVMVLSFVYWLVLRTRHSACYAGFMGPSTLITAFRPTLSK